MINLSKKLIEVRHITESSASSYIRTLFTLNDKAVFKNLAFLKKTETIMSRIEHYAESTQKTLLSGVVSVLSLYEDKPTYKKTYQFYYDRMMGKRKEIADTTIEGKKTAINNPAAMIPPLACKISFLPKRRTKPSPKNLPNAIVPINAE